MGPPQIRAHGCRPNLDGHRSIRVLERFQLPFQCSLFFGSGGGGGGGIRRVSTTSVLFSHRPNRILSRRGPASTSTPDGRKHSRCTEPRGRMPGRASITEGPSALRRGSSKVGEGWGGVSRLWEHHTKPLRQFFVQLTSTPRCYSYLAIMPWQA